MEVKRRVNGSKPASAGPAAERTLSERVRFVKMSDKGRQSFHIDLDGVKTAKGLVEHTRCVFRTGKTKPIAFRKRQLKGILEFLRREEDALCEAVYEDLRKPKHEVVINELCQVEQEVKKFLRNLKEWAAPRPVGSKLINMFDSLSIYSDPYGVVLLISPWNFPVCLLLLPLIGAIAAGNCVIMKPSELASATAKVFQDLLPKYIDPECYPLYLGGVAETTELLKERFDYIFFTGSTQVGKIVHRAASQYLTPVTLELGGKSPAYIDKSANVKIAVKRIMWGKTQNSGQICIAPDYILCSKELQGDVVEYAYEVLEEFFGDDIKRSKDFTRIINVRNFDRLSNYLKNQKISLGGQTDQKDLFIQPTLLTDVNPNNPIKDEEIFGPILPIFNVETYEEAINFINKGEKPLALYVFANKSKVKKAFLEDTSSGAVVINDTIMHYAADGLPFGGVGHSGMGRYRGKESFDTFVHKKSVLSKSFNPLVEKIFSLRYPPYTKGKLVLLRTLQRWNVGLPSCLYELFIFCLGIAVAIGGYFFYIYVIEGKNK